MTTENSTTSKWMPWECGYFDGLKERVAIVPIEKKMIASNSYVGQEYLGLYPYCVKGEVENDQERLWIHKDRYQYKAYDLWVKMKGKPF